MKFKDLKVGDKYMMPDCEAHFMKKYDGGCEGGIVIQGCPGYLVAETIMMYPDNEVSKIVYSGVHRMSEG